MKEILGEIQNGNYAKEFMNEMTSGGNRFKELREKSKNHQIEQIGSEIRSLFSWSKNEKLIDKNKN